MAIKNFCILRNSKKSKRHVKAHTTYLLTGDLQTVPHTDSLVRQEEEYS